jgi:alpha-L-fucosidase 2
MLVQSHAGRIHLLPALPAAWDTGSVKGLRARGGFEVDAAWKNGRLTTAVIHSKAGQPCRVMYKNNTWESNTKVGATYRLDHNLNYIGLNLGTIE